MPPVFHVSGMIEEYTGTIKDLFQYIGFEDAITIV